MSVTESSVSTQPATEDRKLTRIRGGHKGAFTRLQQKVDEFTFTAIDSSTKLFQGEALLKTLQDIISMIHKFDAEIELLKEDEDELANELEQQTEFHVSASVTIARLSASIENYKKERDRPPREFSTDPSSNSATSSRTKLPKNQLPTFTGSCTDWMSFFDLFKASVDSNSHLSNFENLNYLKACVKGEAARLISSISITDANYNIALTLLKHRYENERSIIQAHLQAIWSQPVLKTESALGLRKLLELTNEHLRALVELGQPVEHWNAILVFVLTDKMDPESRKQWQLDNPGTDVLSWELLSQFLDTRSRALESGGTKVTPQSSVTSPCNKGNQNLTKRLQNYAVQGSLCESCQEDHRFYACSQFKGMCLADRHKFVKDKKLCFNCFQSRHSSNVCPSKFTCRECKMKHHTLLHRPQKQLPDHRT